MTRAWRATFALAALLALAGCGGSDAADALDETTSKLGDIESGRLTLKVSVEPDAGDAALGFELEGPFELANPGQLPRADMRYTQVAGLNRGEVGFVSSGSAAWVEVDGQAYELSPDQIERLKAGEGEGGGPLAELEVSSWTRDAELAPGAAAGGGATERVTGRVDVAAAINDLLAVLEEAGASDEVEGLDQLADGDVAQVNDAVRSTSLELTTGKQDRLLRRLRLRIDFALRPRQLPSGLGRLSGAKVTLDLRIGGPNDPIEIEEPQDALPYEQLPRG